MNRFDDLHLDPPVTAAAEHLVARICEQIETLLGHARLNEPICSICIDHGQEDDLDVVPRIFAGRASDRDRIVREAEPDDWTEVWNAYAYRDEEDAVHPFVDEEGEEEYVSLDEEHQAAWQVVRDALDGRVLEPTEWVLARVARKLNRTELPVPATPDLAVWLFDETFGQGSLLEQLAFVLRPETYKALEAAGHIGPDEDSEERLRG